MLLGFSRCRGISGLSLPFLLWCLVWNLTLAATPVLSQAGGSDAPEITKPKVPFNTTGRWIVDADQNRVKLRCINWAGHMQVNIPEGLHKQSVDSLAGWIVREGFNCVRLTFSIDMALNPDRAVEESFRRTAAELNVSETNLLSLHDIALQKNPWLANATVLDVFDKVASSLWDRGLFVILDNHVSKAGWCCNLVDGNGWWSDAALYSEENSRYFDTRAWLDGLDRMAKWAADRPGIIGLALRNEMRATLSQIPFATNIWYEKMNEAAALVHAANPDLLVVIGGINGGTDLMPLRGASLDTHLWEGKNVWEAHVYQFTPTTPSFGICEILKSEMGGLFGFVLEEDRPWTGPLFLSEFGVNMINGPHDGLDENGYSYLTCLVSWLESNDADWAHWAIQGTYYVRDGVVDHQEDWSALNNDWSDWRNPKFKEMLGAMFEQKQGP